MNGRKVTTFDRDLLATICWKIAEGQPLSKILEGATFHITTRTVYDWMDRFPEAAEMMSKARLLSAFAHEDRGLGIVDELLESGEKAISKDLIRARDVALHHMRWTMGRRNPVFAEHHRPSPVMQVNINTNALGDAGPLDSQQFHLETDYSVVEEDPK